MQRSFSQLLELYEAGALSGQELEQFFALLEMEENRLLLEAAIDRKVEEDDNTVENAVLTERAVQSLMKAVRSANRPVQRVHFLRKWGWAAACIILLLSAGGIYFRTINKPPVRIAATMDIAPGSNGAVLTLADGSQMVLDSLGNGVVTTQNGTQVMLNDDQLIYDQAAGKATGSLAYNIMTTPRGRQFRLVLPDGTKVWLNAASSLKYPTAFIGRERKVEVTGEAYFEVTKDAKMPFRVNVNNRAEVEVLGTHFNVNAYTNEASIHTTLLEGAVSVAPFPITSSGQPVVLKPGQQAQMANALTSQKNAIRVVNNADIDKVMAWKNGLFNFEGASLEEVMRQLERWYNIDVVYEKGVPPIRFVGKIKKNIPLKDLLEILERTRVHFRLENERKLVVMP